MLQYINDNSWLLILIKIVLIVFTTNFIATVLRKIWRRNPKNERFLVRKFVYNIVHMLVYLLGIIWIARQIPQLAYLTETILAGSGILALGLSLSAQESLNNVISGLFISIFKPFEVGDRVTLVSRGITGTIEDITLRHTIIKTFTNTRIVIPNAVINSEIVENSNIVDARASAFLDVTVAYESDIDKAIELMAEVIGNHPSYLDIRTEEEKATLPKVHVYVRELGASGICLRANMWTQTVNENFEACSDVRLQIKKIFDENNIEIPYKKFTILNQKEE